MAQYESLLEQLRDQGLDDLADEFEKFSATSLRKKAAGYDEIVKERDELQGRIQELVERPKREQAFREAGVDFDTLRPAERKLIEDLRPEGDLSEEWVAKVISDFGLPVTTSAGSSEGEQPAAEKVAEAALTAPQGKTTGTVISPETASKWAHDKMIAFAEKHPEAWEQLKRGETVTGIAF